MSGRMAQLACDRTCVGTPDPDCRRRGRSIPKVHVRRQAGYSEAQCLAKVRKVKAGRPRKRRKPSDPERSGDRPRGRPTSGRSADLRADPADPLRPSRIRSRCLQAIRQTFETLACPA